MRLDPSNAYAAELHIEMNAVLYQLSDRKQYLDT